MAFMGMTVGILDPIPLEEEDKPSNIPGVFAGLNCSPCHSCRAGEFANPLLWSRPDFLGGGSEASGEV